MNRSDLSLSTIYDYPYLDNISAEVGSWIDRYPLIHKIVLAVSHIFRALCMGSMMMVMPYGIIANGIISFSGALFYRITIERSCPFKFALPAFFGGLFLNLMKHAGPLPTYLWLIAVAYISHRDVERFVAKPCCH